MKQPARSDARPASRLGLRVFIVLAAWMLFGVYMAAQYYLYHARAGLPAVWDGLLLQELTYALLWAALTPLVLWLARRCPIERASWRTRLPLHLLFSVLVSSIHQTLFDLVRMVWIQAPPDVGLWETFIRGLLRFVDYGILLYWIILLVSYTLDYYRRYNEREIKASRLEAQLAQAQLRALRMQLHPHFLFNTLNAISVLIRKDPVAARQTVGQLSELLRLALENAGAQEVPLRTELEFLDRYLQIEKTRFGDRLTVQFFVDPQTLEAQVPNMILQPLVENAIKHGVNKQRGAGVIEIRADRLNGRLSLKVRDNGKGLSVADSIREGVGLANTRARLQKLYGDVFAFDLSNDRGSGVVASLEIPFQIFGTG